jgi:hypothetical protein
MDDTFADPFELKEIHTTLQLQLITPTKQVISGRDWGQGSGDARR